MEAAADQQELVAIELAELHYHLVAVERAGQRHLLRRGAFVIQRRDQTMVGTMTHLRDGWEL